MTKKVLAISSMGGHWVQLRRLRKAWDDCRVVYVTTDKGAWQEVEKDAVARKISMPAFYAVTDANRWNKAKLVKQLLQVLWILVKERPDVIISTGAAPGFFALKFGKFLGARTIWVDSIANAQEMSLSGLKANSCADLYLTQWPELSGCVDQEKSRPKYLGEVV